MAKKTTKAIDKLRSDVQALSEAVWSLKQHVRVEVAGNSAASESTATKSKTLQRLGEQADAGSVRGLVSSYGAYVVTDGSGTQKNIQWQLENVSTETLIPADVDAAAEQLGAIGHKQRLGILIELLDQPRSATDLVTSLELGTTGAAYHHLNVLQNAGFVVQAQRGVYEVAPERVGAVIGILTALTSRPSVDIISSTEEEATESEA